MHFTRKNISSSNHKTFWELMSFVIALFKEEDTLGLLQIWMVTKRFIEHWWQVLLKVDVQVIWYKFYHMKIVTTFSVAYIFWFFLYLFNIFTISKVLDTRSWWYSIHMSCILCHLSTTISGTSKDQVSLCVISGVDKLRLQ